MKRWKSAVLATVATATLFVSPLSAAGEDAASGYTIDEVGPPITAVNIRTAAMGAMPDGTPVVYAPTYGEPARLSVVNGETGALISAHDLGDKTTSTYTGLSPDGSAYAAGQTPGANLFRYDPATDAVSDLGAPVAGESNISRLTTFAADGTLYSGTYPSGHVFSYHPDRGFSDFGPIVDGEQYARSTAFDGDNTLYVGTGTNARLFSMDVTTGDKSEIPLPAEYAGNQTYVNEMYYRDGLLFAFVSPAFAYLIYDTVTGQWREPLVDVPATPISEVVDDRVLFVDRTPNDLFSYELATGAVEQLTQLNQFSINATRGFGLLQFQDSAWPGVTVAGMGLTGRMWHYNLQTEQFRWVSTGAVAGALKIAALGMAPDGQMYAAGYLTPDRMARLDIDTLATEDLTGPMQSQFIDTIEVEGSAPRMYIGGYSDAGVWRFDDSQAWAYPANPSRIAPLSDYEQERVLDMAPAGDRLAVTTLNPKGALGGHLTIIDPLTGVIDYTDEPVPTYAVASVLHQQVDGREVILGGTTSTQLGVEHEDPDARLFVFDLASKTTELVTVPRAGATSISQILQLPDGRIWAVANDSTILELEVTHDAEGYAIEIVETTSIFGEPRGAGQWSGARLDMLDDDTLIGNAAGWIYTVDIATRAIELVTEGNEATATGDGRFFFVRNTVVFRGTPDGWVAPDPVDPGPEPVEPTNYALAGNGGSATGSSAYGAYVPENVIDGDVSDVSSRWITTADDVAPWLDVAFAEEVVIDTVSLYQFGGYELADYDVSAEVAGEWVRVAEVRGNKTMQPVHRFDGVAATAMRIDGFTSPDGRVRLYEVEVTCEVDAKCETAAPSEPPATSVSYAGANHVLVTLAAEAGSAEVERVEYRLHGGEWGAYSEPFEVMRSDRQTLQYRGVGGDGALEVTRCVSFAPGGGLVDVTIAPEQAACE